MSWAKQFIRWLKHCRHFCSVLLFESRLHNDVNKNHTTLDAINVATKKPTTERSIGGMADDTATKLGRETMELVHWWTQQRLTSNRRWHVRTVNLLNDGWFASRVRYFHTVLEYHGDLVHISPENWGSRGQGQRRGPLETRQSRRHYCYYCGRGKEDNKRM